MPARSPFSSSSAATACSRLTRQEVLKRLTVLEVVERHLDWDARASEHRGPTLDLEIARDRPLDPLPHARRSTTPFGLSSQRREALANKLLRTLWALAVTGAPYQSAIARGEVRPQPIAA